MSLPADPKDCGSGNVPFPADITQDLNNYIKLPFELDDDLNFLAEDKTIQKISGLRYFVNTREHAPPHFHVEQNGTQARFTVCDCTPLDGNSLGRVKNKIRKWHEQNRDRVIRFWNQTRPHGCPVGKTCCDETA